MKNKIMSLCMLFIINGCKNESTAEHSEILNTYHVKNYLIETTQKGYLSPYTDVIIKNNKKEEIGSFSYYTNFFLLDSMSMPIKIYCDGFNIKQKPSNFILIDTSKTFIDKNRYRFKKII